MKKLLVLLIVAISLLSTLTSCEDYAEKADYEEQQANETGHEGIGDDVEEPPMETGN